MKRWLLKSKIHRASITGTDLNYVGSLTLDADLMRAAGLAPHEKVQVVNINNGARFETYLFEGEPGKGEVCLNGAAARLGEIGDVVVIISYGLLDDEELKTFEPQVIHVNEKNQIIPWRP